MKENIKQIIKFTAALALGGIIGLMGAFAAIVLFTDRTFGELWSKISHVNLLEILGVMLLSLLIGIVSFVLHIILHEGGHLLAGWCTGYRFVSFRIGSFTLIRSNNKWCIKKFSIAGTGGQCLMSPPRRPIEDIPTSFYNLGGILINLLTSIIALLFFPLATNAPTTMFITIFAFIGILIALINGIPMKVGGVSNDGNNVLFLNKNKRAKEAFVYQLIINADIQEGVLPRNIDNEYLTFDLDIDYKDPLIVNWLLATASTLIDRHEYMQAYNMLHNIMQHKDDIIELFRHETTCELIFTALMTGHTTEAQDLYDDTLSHYVEQHLSVMSSKQRLLCAIAYYIHKDTAQAQEIYQNLLDKRTSYLMQGEVAMDLELMNEILSDKKEG